MDMGKERLTRGLLLRLGILLTAVCVCVHVYLETAWRGAPAALTQGRPTQPDRAKQVPAAEAGQQDRSVKRRISYVRTLKKEARKRDEDPSSPCCLPRRPHRKVRLIFPELLAPLIAAIRVLFFLFFYLIPSQCGGGDRQSGSMRELSLHLL